MSTKISPREVLAYLNYLGYHNINPQQLKEFVQDLKKLIKYEERKRNKEKYEYDTSTPKDIQLDEKSETGRNEDLVDDIFTALYLQGTHSSRAKTVPKKESIISLKIKTSKPHQCSQHNYEKTVDTVKNKEDSLDYVPCKDIPNEEVKKPDSKKPTSKKTTNVNKPKSSFIRPAAPTNNKSDPVALFHQYQIGWKRHKIPGEDNRTDLRWAIREKMMSGPRISRA